MSDEKPIKLNIGAGPTVIDGWTAIDRKFGTEAYPLDYADNSVDEMRVSHLLEHFSFKEAKGALIEWSRVLKPGGRIRISVPDFERMSTADEMWPFYLMGGQTDENDFHKSVYNVQRLTDYMQAAGFQNVGRWESDNIDTASNPISLNLEGVKQEVVKQVKICALMSVPRIGWNDNWGCILEALQPFNIPVHRFNGVFWGPCMQNAMEFALDHDVTWMLTIDYDSMFSKWHVNTLLRELGSNSHIDAIAAMQSKRGCEFPLITAKGADGKMTERLDLDGNPVNVNTAHFGLTLLRSECFAKLPKPWFLPQPDPVGSWGDGRVDPDIYFWKLWQEAGFNIHMSTQVRIGHLELIVSDFDEEYKHRQMSVPDWRKLNEMV